MVGKADGVPVGYFFICDFVYLNVGGANTNAMPANMNVSNNASSCMMVSICVKKTVVIICVVIVQ